MGQADICFENSMTKKLLYFIVSPCMKNRTDRDPSCIYGFRIVLNILLWPFL